MKHLNNYNNFKLNEELTRNQKEILYLPLAVVSLGLKKLFGVYPMLNLRWSELKKSTKNSKYPSIFHKGSIEILKDNIQKVSKKDIPDNTMKVGMLLSKWNIYLSERKSKGGVFGTDAIERPIIYISKDEIQKGDKYTGYRLNDSDIYPDFKKSKDKGYIKPENLAEYPLIIMIAKFDYYKELKDKEIYVDDICLELEDDYPFEVKPSFNNQGDKLYLSISIQNRDKKINYQSELIDNLKEVSERICDFLEGNWTYKINLSIVGPFHYYGNAGRFPEIIEMSKKHSRQYDYDSDSPMWNNYSKSLNISKIWNIATQEDLRIRPEDVDTLISDIDLCFTNQNIKRYELTLPAYESKINRWRIKQDDINIKAISIVFDKN
jgi:hypothetical protein